MRFTYLGTSTAEGLPTLSCKCPVCERSRALGGRNLRTRMQAMIDGKLLLDFGPETLAHFQREGLCLADFTDVLITHSHEDHLDPVNVLILQEGYSHPPKGTHITFHGTEPVGDRIRQWLDGQLKKEGTASFDAITPFVPFRASAYTVTPLPATHAPKTGPVIYQITDGDKSVLYAHDTNLFSEEVWNYWKSNPIRFDFVSLDCTYALAECENTGHMNFERNKLTRERMLSMGLADSKTRFVCSHFSHNGGAVAWDDFAPIAEKEGFETSFDGMTIEI